MGEYEPASGYFLEGIELIRRLDGHKQGMAFGLFHLGRIARIQGEFDSAQSRLVESLKLFQEAGDRRGIGYVLAAFVTLSAAQGNLRGAAQLGGVVASLQDVLGSFLEAPLQIEYDRQLAELKEALGEDAFNAALAEGRTMTAEEGVEFALDGM